MNYKKYIKNKKLRFKILHFFKFLPDVFITKVQYFIKTSRFLNLKNPKRFTEKIQFYKLFYHKKILNQCADKWGVRAYIKSKGLSHILNEVYGIYNNFDEISFESLPKKFVIKTTYGSGMNLFCSDKNNFNFDVARKKIEHWLSIDMYLLGREWCYKGINRKLIIENFLEDTDNDFIGLNDYKILCFNGRAKYIWVDVDRQTSHKRNFYDLDWNYIDVESDHPNFGDCLKKPKNLHEMIKIANVIATDFPFVRVDLYSIGKKIIFGELTFYPCTGYLSFKPDSFDFSLGQEFVLPKN